MTQAQVHITEIPAANGLDPIIVYWHDVAPGKGHVTIICYGAAWSTYFGAMNGRRLYSNKPGNES